MPPLSPGSSSPPNFAAELNEQQLAAVSTGARHALVIAGAGSGKTRTLTYRVAWLLRRGVPGWRILLLTFTNKAAREMLERVQSLVGEEARHIMGGTFHSVANRILRRHAELIGFRSGFSILDTDDQKSLMRSIVKQHVGKRSKTDPFPKADFLLSLHSLATNTGRALHDVLLQESPQNRRHEETLQKIFTDYAQRKRDANAMDFDDLLVNLQRLLEEHEEVRLMMQERFLHVLVDEYQDTNPLQDRLISLLCGGSRTSLMVVGDDAQSIYSWRGARVEHILEFPDRFPDTVLYKIETNYRSVAPILAISDAAIAQNEHRFSKTLRPARREEARLPLVVPAPDNRTEAQYVALSIEKLIASGMRPCDIAVLYRAHFHSLDTQIELTRRHIPYRITSGLRFFEQAHIKDAVAYLRLLSNPADESSFLRMVARLPRVGDASAARLLQAWRTAWLAYAAGHADYSSAPIPFSEIMSAVHPPAAAKPQWDSFLATLESLRPADNELSPSEMIVRVTGDLEPFLAAQYENAEDRIQDLEQLARSMEDVPDLDDFLSRVALLSETDRAADATDGENCVTLSTIHQAKGLEWRAVFLIFLGEGLFPHHRSIAGGDPREMEEETRLFYVALTRAQDLLFLSYPRYNGHSYDSPYCPPSRFLTSLPPELYDVGEA